LGLYTHVVLKDKKSRSSFFKEYSLQRKLYPEDVTCFAQTGSGITLIALVVTIIILLILAGVTISIIAGSNGLFNKTENAVEISNYATAKEKVELAVAASFDETATLNEEMLKENLNQTIGINPKVDEVSFNLLVNVDGYQFVITKAGKIKSQREGDSLEPIITHEITPEEGITADSVEIKVMADYGNTGIYSIRKPDGTVEKSNTVTYTATENKDYEFIIKDNDGIETPYMVTITNVSSTYYLYNRGVSNVGTFTSYHTGNGYGSLNIANNYLEISTQGQTGAGGAHVIRSTEKIGTTGYKMLNIIYEVVSTTSSGSHNECRMTCFGTTKVGKWSPRGQSVGTYTDSVSLGDDEVMGMQIYKFKQNLIGQMNH